jgi:superfamily II DNA or RNA helicase
MPEFKLRYHQQKIVDCCRDILSGAVINEIILSVTPGGGKSFVPVILAENLIPKIANRICWVVPRNALKYQGEGEFADPRWNTTKRIRAADNGEDLSRGLEGYATTYQAIGQNPECHEAEFKRHKYILFLDECHHVAEGSEWHKALEPLVKNAVLVVKASGTLSRGDGNKIAFMPYSCGRVDLSENPGRRIIVYGRNRAIADKAILSVEFRTVDGDAEWEEQDGSKGSSKLSGEESAKALFTALRTEFADYLLDSALEEFQAMRQKYENAKMLVVAPNIEIAKAYWSHLAD